MSIPNAFSPCPSPSNQYFLKETLVTTRQNESSLNKGEGEGKPEISKRHHFPTCFRACPIYFVWDFLKNHKCKFNLFWNTFYNFSFLVHLRILNSKICISRCTRLKNARMRRGRKNFKTLVSLHFISNYAGNSFSFASPKLQLKSSCC